MVTTDKVYANREWAYGYRESDRLGGHDPYSASKAATELAIASWRASFCGPGAHQNPHLRIAKARAGNVIGGGDWARDRIVPDAIRALAMGNAIAVRNPAATRPWQEVLEPLGGYLLLAQQLLARTSPLRGLQLWPHPQQQPLRGRAGGNDAGALARQLGRHQCPSAPHEAGLLHFQNDKAHHKLGWQPRWDYATTPARTVNWYRDLNGGAGPYTRKM